MFTTFNLDYSYVINPKLLNSRINTYYETNQSIWKIKKSNNLEYKIIDNFSGIEQIVNQGNEQINLQLVDKSIIVEIHGEVQFVNYWRTTILSNFNMVSFKSVFISDIEFLKIDQKFINELIKLSQRYEVEIIVNNSKMNSASILDNNIYAIHIIGYKDNVSHCEVSLRVLIDHVLHGHFIDCLTIELSMIPILGGTDLFNFNQIAQQTKCNIYIPDLLPNLFNSNIISTTRDYKIWFTSKNISDLLLTKHVIDKFLDKEHQLMCKDVNIVKSKLDLIILNNQNDIIDLMFKYGVFIQMPSLGESEKRILVQGVSTESINDCICELNLMASKYYILSGKNINAPLGKSCVMIGDSTSVQVVGNAQDIKRILGYSIINPTIVMEISNGQKDFISGKKNGKIAKILNQVDNQAKINFKALNEYNFDIILQGANLPTLLELIEMEFPSELNFNIPEVFHKSIIGNGGSIIQSIMKKYNVFIKFESEKNKTRTNFSFKRTNNVLIKCPMKNSKSINLVKHDIDQLVYKCCMNNNQNGITTIYHSIKFQLLKSHYLMLVNNNKLNTIYQIENDYSSFINFPTNLSNFKCNDLIIDIKGSESKIKYCAKQLKSILPNNYEFKLTWNQLKFNQLFDLNRQDFNEKIVIPFKILLGLEILVNESPINVNNNQEILYHQVIISYFKENQLQLSTAIESLTHFLRDKGFLIYEKGEIEFNPLIEPIPSSSPVKINNFNMPLRPITNFVELNELSPTKNKSLRMSPVKLSPIKIMNLNKTSQKQYNQSVPYSPTKQQTSLQPPFNYSPMKNQLQPVKFDTSSIYNVY